MTQIHPITITTTHTTRRHLALTMLLGVSIGAAGVVGAMQYVPVVVASNEAAMMAACRLPDVNGAITVFTMRDSKIECGRYK